MPRYTIQRSVTHEIEVEAENGEQAAEIANQTPIQDWPYATLDDDTYYQNDDDEEDEGSV